MLGWFVLDLTNSPILVGLALALRHGSLLLIGLARCLSPTEGIVSASSAARNTTMASP